MEKAEKGNNTDESDFSENEMLDLNSLNLNQKQTSESLTVVASDDQKQPLAVVP